jgi:hypothetical protein
MKKIAILLTSLVLITSCNEKSTTTEQDMQMLQTKNPNSIVYRINSWNYISCDSLNVYHITVTVDGEIDTKIRIK